MKADKLSKIEELQELFRSKSPVGAIAEASDSTIAQLQTALADARLLASQQAAHFNDLVQAGEKRHAELEATLRTLALPNSAAHLASVQLAAAVPATPSGEEASKGSASYSGSEDKTAARSRSRSAEARRQREKDGGKA